jgi:hypothetical protein
MPPRWVMITLLVWLVVGVALLLYVKVTLS